MTTRHESRLPDVNAVVRSAQLLPVRCRGKFGGACTDADVRITYLNIFRCVRMKHGHNCSVSCLQQVVSVAARRIDANK